MRDLFDEVAGKSPLDPQEAVRRESRVPKRKRFYKEAGVTESEGGFAVTLVLGLLVNLFSAVYVSRTIFMWLLSRKGRRVESLSI